MLPLVELEHVSKAFGATQALRDVGFTVPRGEVHGLLGENGAGKSTLMKILSGVVVPDQGRIAIGRGDLPLGNLVASRTAGIAMAYQELSSPANISVAEKLCMPNLPRGPLGLVSQRRVLAAATEKLEAWEVIGIDPRRMVGDLNLAQRQYVEITSALANNPAVLILDEPTAALPDTEWLFHQIAKLTTAGSSVIYISHKIAEIREICHRGTVLRNGQVVGSFSTDEMEAAHLVRLMIGRTPEQTFPRKALTDDHHTVLTVKNARLEPRLLDVDITVSKGEVVGLAALEGQGQRDLFYAIAGLLRLDSGEISLQSAGPGPGHRQSRRPNTVLVPEERKTEALFSEMTANYNLTISNLSPLRRGPHVSRRLERAYVERAAGEVNLPVSMLEKPISSLSGGNQQKVIFGRALLSDPVCLLLFDPTRGVDAATKVEIYHMTRRYAEQGGTVLMYSTEIPELVGVCDRVYSLYNGRIREEHVGLTLSDETIMHAILGQHHEVRDDD